MNDNLHARISHVLAETESNDPREIAELVAKATSDHEVRSFYSSSLIGTVRKAMGTQRNSALTNAMRPNHVRSAKVAGIRDWWAEMCAARIHVGESKWTTLGECSARELQFAAMERRTAADREIARAAMYDELRSLLRTHKVRTVGELPDDAARAVAQVAA